VHEYKIKTKLEEKDNDKKWTTPEKTWKTWKADGA
jgi:hypothetical protein